MPQYKVEYRECPEGVLLKSNLFLAGDAEKAEVEVRRAFTLVQINMGARQYQILDSARAVVATHSTTDIAQPSRGRV